LGALNLTAPVIAGTAEVGNTLTVTPGTWIKSFTLKYQWQRGGVDISGATTTTYTVTLDDAGTSITCKEYPEGSTAALAGVASNALAIFSPLELTSLAAWYDPADTSTITSSGGAVSQLNDKSTNARHVTQSTAALQPVTGSETINSRNVLTFNTNDVLLFGAGAIPAGAAFTVFSLTNMTSFTTVNRSILGGTTGSPNFRFQASVPGAMQIVRQAQAVVLTGTNAATAGQTHISTWKAITAGCSIWKDGVANGSNATNPSFTQPIQYLGGSSSAGGEGLVGKLGDVIVCAASLSTDEMNKTGRYLAYKWGTTWTNI
jgi:hypothetical protein